MKVHFVFAPPRGAPNPSHLMAGVAPPLGLLYVAAFVRRHLPDLELAVTDGTPLGLSDALAEVRRTGADVLFLSCVTSTALGAYALADAVKRDSPRTLVVLGGPHGSALPDEALRRSATDLVVVGEGERTAVEVLREFQSGRPDWSRVLGLAWRGPAGPVLNAPRPLVPDLDEFPFPARDLVRATDYDGWFLTRRSPDTLLVTARGCPHGCSFCANSVFRRSLRLRSPGNIVAEVERLRTDHGIREFFDVSDEVNTDLDHARALCEAIRTRLPGFAWKCQVRATHLPEDLVRDLARSGCWYVQVGIESASDRTLRGVGKGTTTADVERALSLLKQYGIQVFGLFMPFHAWDDGGRLAFEGVEDTGRTLRWARDLHSRRLIDWMSWSIPMPWPGAPLYDLARRHGLFRDGADGDWDRWAPQGEFVFDLPGVPRNAMSRLYAQGSLLRAWCFARSGSWNLGHVPRLARKTWTAIRGGLTRGR